MSKNSGRLWVRFTPEDIENINKEAIKESTYPSTWVRRVVLRYMAAIGIRKKSKKEVREYSR